ncbi:MAG TPA: Ig-like domain-containing protein [Gemmatimonadaceae bacterium]|nr:Ig-like domain-containing protein [Gemmatimonadaceae bacterium]
MRRQLLGLLGLVVVISCQDSVPSGVIPPSSLNPLLDISDGRSGGNPEAFWGTPLATNPQPGDVNFDVGGAHALLQPYVRICETNGTPGLAGCVVDVTLATTGVATGLVMSFNSGSEFYTASWQTNQLNTAKQYRVEIWGVAFTNLADRNTLDPRWLFTWRDVGNSPFVSACTTSQPICFIKFGQTIPVKVRLEQFVFCPSARNCGMQFISAGQNANLEAQLTGAAAPSAQLFVPGQNATNFALAFEPCTAAEDAAVVNTLGIPTYGPCLRTETPFTGTLGTPAIISLCDNLDPSSFGLSHSQEHQLALHHISEDLTRIQALPEAWQCTTPTSGVASTARSGLFEYARGLGERMLQWITPKPLFAAATMIDRGGGGESPFLNSLFKLALPAKFEYVVATDASQTANAGDVIVLRAKVTDLFGAPVMNARVGWQAVTPPNDGATVLGTVPAGPTLTDATGVAQNSVTLNAFRGFNVFRAVGRGIADDRATGCTVLPSTSSTCNGPRASYDPFLALKVPEIDASGVETPVELPVGTRLLFTIFGRGRPAP